MEDQLYVTVIQSFIHWENRDENLAGFTRLTKDVDGTDLIVLPEMFTTGFSMNPALYAEETDGESMRWMYQTARKKNCVVTGSIMTRESGRYYNRLVWMRPSGEYLVYDKRHLFRFAGEHKHYTPGSRKLLTRVKGWKIYPLICYDLRFPVWCKNRLDAGSYDYDLMINIANWPAARSVAWKTLLSARAIENQSFVCGVNRVGEDGNGIDHSGDSLLAGPEGNLLWQAEPSAGSVETVTLQKEALENSRGRLEAGLDWDTFAIETSGGQPDIRNIGS